MTCEDQLAQALKESGNRPTPQRIMILSAVRHADGHITASEALRSVQRSYPFIDASTVYRTLDMLKRMRLVSETRMGGDSLSYEWIGEREHHHLICERCDAVAELDDGFMDAMSADILRAHGFAARVQHLALFGRCRDCRSVPAADNAPESAE